MVRFESADSWSKQGSDICYTIRESRYVELERQSRRSQWIIHVDVDSELLDYKDKYRSRFSGRLRYSW